MKKIIFIAGICSLLFCSCTESEPLKIMSYNIRNAKGMDNVKDYKRVADVILKSSPDLVAVQELDSMTNRSGKTYILGDIADEVQMYDTYLPAISFDGGKYGIGILSKVEPLCVKRYALPGREEERALLVAEFQDFIFACTHLSLTKEDRMASLEIIFSASKEHSKPFYLAGDFNDTPGSEFIGKLQENFTVLNFSNEFTFPADTPNRTLDYIVVYTPTAEGVEIVGEEVLNEPVASDHRPVVVEVK